MYSQYQYYQQPSQAVASQQGPMTWNGSSWVPSSCSATSSTYSTYEPTAKQSSAVPPRPVETYTEYYHAWTAHAKECEDYLRKLGPGNESQKAQVTRQVEWAKYYADESSRAAHHFYSNPDATSAPFELPPAPPKNTAATALQTTQYQQQQQHQNPHEQKQASDENTPGSLTRYVKRCIDQCSTDEQRKAVQAQVERAIADSIQNGSLHTKNWETVPLIPVPGKLSFSISQKPKNHRDQHHRAPIPQNISAKSASNADIFFNRNQTKASSKYSRRYDEKLPENDSYYGRSAGDTEGSKTQMNSAPRQRAQARNDSYYGPASASTSHSSARAPSSSPRNNSNMTSSVEVSPSLSQTQKRVVSPEEDFIAFQQKRKNKKHKKNGFETSNHVLAKRANRFSGPGGILDASRSTSTVDGHDQYMGKKLIGGSTKTLDEEDFQKMTVKGTCQTLEKDYLRLTAPPRAELVRPKPILERHLANLKQAYAEKKRDYLWFCSQLKAIRQDCTVQRIQCDFTVDVYETHARIALQEGDLNEYNQCQTQLKELYELGHTMGNENEFIAYRLLYYVFLSTNEKYDGGSSDMFKILLSLTPEQRKHPAIAHALKTREALSSGDYIRFFRLHKDAPGLSRCLSDLIVPTMRMRGLRRMVKAYRPSLEVEVFMHQLGFDSMENCTQFLKSCGCMVEGSNCSTKDSTVHEPVEEKKNSLI